MRASILAGNGERHRIDSYRSAGIDIFELGTRKYVQSKSLLKRVTCDKG